MDDAAAAAAAAVKVSFNAVEAVLSRARSSCDVERQRPE